MRRSSPHARETDDLADAMISASAVLVEAAESALIDLVPDLNLTDFRVLALLEQRGPLRLVDIAEALGVTSTSATRLADRLAAHELVVRVRQSDDRREIHLAATVNGTDLVESVLAKRREHLAPRLRDVPASDRAAALRVLRYIAAAGATAETESA